MKIPFKLVPILFLVPTISLAAPPPLSALFNWFNSGGAADSPQQFQSVVPRSHGRFSQGGNYQGGNNQSRTHFGGQTRQQYPWGQNRRHEGFSQGR